MSIKYLASGIVFLGLIGLIFISYEIYEPSNNDNSNATESIVSGVTPVQEGKFETVVFTGKLQAINTGCFADGECSVVVDGKHVTVLLGWNQDTVGSVQGVLGFGDLESYIGSNVEVYAQTDINTDNSYTLYGNEEFYIKLTGDTSLNKSDKNTTKAEVVPELSGDEPKKPILRNDCMVGGCSSQICGEANYVNEIISTCEYRPEYACYNVATCERQVSGQCGWTITSELTQCLNSKGNELVM